MYNCVDRGFLDVAEEWSTSTIVATGKIFTLTIILFNTLNTIDRFWRKKTVSRNLINTSIIYLLLYQSIMFLKGLKVIATSLKEW